MKRIQESIKIKYDWDEKHREATAIKNVDKTLALKKKLDHAAAELGFDVWRMFEDAEKSPEQLEREAKDLQNYQEIIKRNKPADMMPKKATEDEMRAKRAALFDKLVSDRGNAAKIPTAETKTVEVQKAETKVLMSAKDLSEPQRAADRGIKFGAAREKAAKMKELESSFTEITREDIAKANKDVKKPIIGGHRKK